MTHEVDLLGRPPIRKRATCAPEPPGFATHAHAAPGRVVVEVPNMNCHNGLVGDAPDKAQLVTLPAPPWTLPKGPTHA